MFQMAEKAEYEGQGEGEYVFAVHHTSEVGVGERGVVSFCGLCVSQYVCACVCIYVHEYLSGNEDVVYSYEFVIFSRDFEGRISIVRCFRFSTMMDMRCIALCTHAYTCTGKKDGDAVHTHTHTHADKNDGHGVRHDILVHHILVRFRKHARTH